MAAKIVTIVTSASQCGKTGDDLESRIVTRFTASSPALARGTPLVALRRLQRQDGIIP